MLGMHLGQPKRSVSSLDSPHQDPRMCKLRHEAEVQSRAESHFYTYWKLMAEGPFKFKLKRKRNNKEHPLISPLIKPLSKTRW